MTALKIGSLICDLDHDQKIWAISGGFAEVLPDRVVILAETAEPAESIDRERAEAARQRALRRLQERDQIQNFDANRATAALAKAVNRINIAAGIKRD